MQCDKNSRSACHGVLRLKYRGSNLVTLLEHSISNDSLERHHLILKYSNSSTQSRRVARLHRLPNPPPPSVRICSGLARPNERRPWSIFRKWRRDANPSVLGIEMLCLSAYHSRGRGRESSTFNARIMRTEADNVHSIMLHFSTWTSGRTILWNKYRITSENF